MPAVALTDTNNLFALLEFSMAAGKEKIQPICGVNVNLLYEHEHKAYLAEILLLAKDKQGYENLLNLVSAIYLNNQRQPSEHITFADLIQYNAGLIMLSGYDNGVIGELIYRGYEDKAKYYANYFKDLFGDRFYFEIMRHGLEKQKIIESRYLKLSLELDIPIVATNNVLFASIEDHDKHDTLLCIASGKLKAETSRPTVSNQCYFKSPTEMAKTFADLPSAISNSYYISKRCAVMATTNPPILPSFANKDISEEDALTLKVNSGLSWRLSNKFKYENISDIKEQDEIAEIYQARLDYELKIICGMKFAGYFLIVSDFIEWSKNNNISVGPGRGSVVGSIIAWSLRITDLDPIKFGLLFERFLNPERVSMPDIDIDFCQERRDEVLKYITKKYGADRVANIITFGSMQAKAVIKDVSRVLGLRYDIANSITELVPFNAVNPVTLSQATEQVPELRNAYQGKGLFSIELRDYEDPKQTNSLIKKVLDNALTLEGLQRHVSMHAAGIVISGEELLKLVPIYRDSSSQNNVIQYSMKYAELVGLVKFDLLGLQTLTLISKTLELLAAEGIIIDISNISLDDKKTYKLLSSGDTNGVFQFESFGMKDSIKKIKPDSIGDLIALGALYRPGPMDNIPTYVACKHKKQEPDYLHPLLEEVLKETYGVIIYQEQVMEIAKILGGYSLGSADLLRRAMGKKIKAEMDAQEKIFMQGAAKKNVDVDQAREIFASVAKFAGYGFNKSHAAGYAFISYQTAYLKANYLPEFLTACLNLDINDQSKINNFVQEAHNRAIAILPPDVNNSNSHFVIKKIAKKKNIAFGLAAIKSISHNLGEAIEKESVKKKFISIFDFIERIPMRLLNKRALEHMILAGCFSNLHPNARQLVENIDLIMSHGALSESEKNSNQFSLIPLSLNAPKMKEVGEDFSPTTKCENEFDLLGVFLTYHPMRNYRDLISKMAIYDSKKLDLLRRGSSNIKIAGIIQKKDIRMSDKGVFVSLQLSDEIGVFDVTIFSDRIFQNYSHFIEVKKRILLTCEAYKDETSLRLSVVDIEDLDEFAFKTAISNINLNITSEDKLHKLTNFLKSKELQGSDVLIINLSLNLDNSPFVAKVNITGSFNLTLEDIRSLETL